MFAKAICRYWLKTISHVTVNHVMHDYWHTCCILLGVSPSRFSFRLTANVWDISATIQRHCNTKKRYWLIWQNDLTERYYRIKTKKEKQTSQIQHNSSNVLLINSQSIISNGEWNSKNIMKEIKYWSWQGFFTSTIYSLLSNWLVQRIHLFQSSASVTAG